MNTKPKKSFKINLISADTASRTGGVLYDNNTYAVNMRSIIRDPEDYKKTYKMTFKFITGRNSGAILSLLTGSSFGIELDFRKGLPIEQHDKSVATYSGIINGYMLPTSTGTYDQRQQYLHSRPKDNQPAYFQDIQNIDSITLSVFNTRTTSNYPPNMNYVCVVTFTEI